jgi:hypothetical protein
MPGRIYDDAHVPAPSDEVAGLRPSNEDEARRAFENLA